MAEKEYIERDVLREKLNQEACDCEFMRLLSDIPAADVVPVVRGRWDDSGRYQFPSGAKAIRCSICGCALSESEYRLFNWNYCPVCGAKMDLEGGGGK